MDERAQCQIPRQWTAHRARDCRPATAVVVKKVQRIDDIIVVSVRWSMVVSTSDNCTSMVMCMSCELILLQSEYSCTYHMLHQHAETTMMSCCKFAGTTTAVVTTDHLALCAVHCRVNLALCPLSDSTEIS